MYRPVIVLYSNNLRPSNPYLDMVSQPNLSLRRRTPTGAPHRPRATGRQTTAEPVSRGPDWTSPLARSKITRTSHSVRDLGPIPALQPGLTAGTLWEWIAGLPSDEEGSVGVEAWRGTIHRTGCLTLILQGSAYRVEVRCFGFPARQLLSIFGLRNCVPEWHIGATRGPGRVC